MFRVDIENKRLIELTPTGFTAMGLRERFDIQEWIEKSPSILGEQLLVIGKELTLESGRRLDLLAIDKSASLVVIELKRDDTGASAEWQAIKYASYCSNLTIEEIFSQLARYRELAEGEAEKLVEEFIDADFENLNASQRIILAAKEFHSEVISAVLWLREFGVNIQCTRLAPYVDADNALFIKPEIIIPLPEARDYIERKEQKRRVAATSQSEWTGYWFVNVGEGEHRTWDDNVKYGFVGAGQGRRYSSALKRLKVGDKLYAYAAGLGYVGFGQVISSAVPIREFVVEESGVPLLEENLTAANPSENADDDELCEWVVGVKWEKTVPFSKAKTFTGVFANQNIVCKLRNEQTLRFVQKEFGE
ncbi:MAG: MmcB family DNA repair protein [Pseudomonadales bacterium]|nr:MmcB family DNA repair protein [Pseudomonadales bacterium]